MLYINNIGEFDVVYIQRPARITMPDTTLLDETRERYTAAVARGESNVAEAIVDHALSRGATPPDIYLSVLAPAQVLLGEMWHRGEINIAQEHLATAITVQMMDRQRQNARPRTPRGLRALVTPVQDDEHSVGARMIADLLIMDGWDVDFFWDATPAKDLGEYVQLRRVNLLALSVTMTECLPNVFATSEIIRTIDPPRPKILLGGAAVELTDIDPDELGVDAVATDVSIAAQQALDLVTDQTNKPSLDQQLAIIGRQIRAARDRRQFTQQNLADVAGLDRTYISLVEHGKQNLTIGATLKIADALNIPITDLFATHNPNN
ncbi:MAG: helix-turn-helix domain-containing protein [Chloroflexi bacterium]|nr:helix-turn-helix domain-containing protein [Chloroflexota bacterium]